MQTSRDQNRVPVALATSNADGVTPVMLQADPVTHSLSADINPTGDDRGINILVRDENGETVLGAVSSEDGATVVPIFIDPSTSKLLLTS